MQDNVNQYKVWGNEARQNPHALYATMREEAPIYKATGPVSGNTFWFFTRYEDCAALLKDQRFIKESGKIFPQEDGNVPQHFAVLNRHMLNLDPPDHTRLRSLVHKAFTPRMVENLRPRIAAIADELLHEIRTSGDKEFDLMSRYAFPLPIIVIAELLGIPAADRDRFRVWTQALLGNATSEEEAANSAMEVLAYFTAVFEERRTNPQEDLISNLLMVEEGGEKLDHTEMFSMIFLLLVAGHETTVNLITNGMLALLDHPDQYERLRSEPTLTRNAVEEMLRFQGPLENTLARWASEDTEFDGQTIRRGEIVMATLMGANRDPLMFTNPDQFDIGREPNRHLAFGGGIHYCLGAPLARLEGEIAFASLLRELPHLSLATERESLRWRDEIIIRGLQGLPVKLG